jgi:hypothetical protein
MAKNARPREVHEFNLAGEFSAVSLEEAADIAQLNPHEIEWAIEELQADLDVWLEAFNRERPHQGRWCFGKTPMQTFLDAKPMAKEKMIAA